MKQSDSDEQVAAPRGPQASGERSATGPVRRFVWGLPLGWQLGALYALLLVLTLSLVGALVYWQQEGFLVQDAGQRLVLQAERIAAIPEPRPRTVQDQSGAAGAATQTEPTPPPRTDTENPEDHLVRNLVRGLSGQGVTAAVLDTTGTVITSTQALEGGSAPVVEPVTAEQVTQALASRKPVQWTVVGEDGTRQAVVLMAVSQQLPAASPNTQGTQQAAQAAQAGSITLLVEQVASLAAADAALRSLGVLLLLGVVAGTVVGVALVLAFTRGVLRPLDRVVDTADAIAGGDLHRRLNLPAGRSEVAHLGRAFDYMVGWLVAALEAQHRFVADASHELRTPLTSLKGLAEILVIGAHGNDTRVIEQSARAINSELERLMRLVADLLTLSRLDNTDGGPGGQTAHGAQGVPRARRAPMDVCATVRAAADQMAGLAEVRGIHLSQECSGPLLIVGDSGQIKQVLLNLVDNALRYTPEGGRVAIKGSVQDGQVVVDVRDTGSGIAAKDLPHIFERFYRGDSSRSRATGNSGLGLAIAHSIVEAHGGSIEVKSGPGEGTCFTIRLSLAPGTAAVEKQAEPAGS